VQPPTNLQELVDQLGKTYSPFERLKILGRGWALLRQMTPEQRMIVATQLGLDHADELVEAITRRSGKQASPALISLIEKAQVKGTPHLPELIADLRDPARRAERMRQGAQAALNTAEAALEGKAPEVPWLPPGAATPTVARPAPAAPRPAAAAPAPPQKPAPSPAPPSPPAVAAVPVAPPAPVTAAPAPPPQPAPTPAPAPEPRPAAARPTATPRPAPAVPTAPPAPRPAPVQDDVLASRLAAVPSLIARFRLLRLHAEEAKGMSAAGLRSLVESFPDGWARRRALLELLRGGVPGSLRDALALIGALESDRDRLWCLGALTDSHEIQESERETLLAMANSPTARRRLERRLGL
jgi:hypothetical protein